MCILNTVQYNAIVLMNSCVYFKMEEGADMHSLLMTENNTMLMGGLQNYVLEFDLNTVQQTQKVYCMTPACENIGLTLKMQYIFGL